MNKSRGNFNIIENEKFNYCFFNAEYNSIHIGRRILFPDIN